MALYCWLCLVATADAVRFSVSDEMHVKMKPFKPTDP